MTLDDAGESFEIPRKRGEIQNDSLRERKERLCFSSRITFVGQGYVSEEGYGTEVFNLVLQIPDLYTSYGPIWIYTINDKQLIEMYTVNHNICG